jgi:hypothetical protein
VKVGDLVQANHYGKRHGPVGIIISRALTLPSDWWIVEWAGSGSEWRARDQSALKRETIRSEHLKVIS